MTPSGRLPILVEAEGGHTHDHTICRRALVLVLVTLVAGVAGCSKEQPGIVTEWPDASVERSTPRPAEAPKWPLTGLEAPSEDAIAARVVSVKVENSRESRPQSNLQLADVVYESVTEGGITRFNAIFHSSAPTVVGPVRSARLSDVDIVRQYNALFCFSGASSSVNAQIRSAGIENLSEDAGVTKPFTRSSARARPHNLYVDVAEVRAEAQRRGMPATQPPVGLAFEKASAPATPTIMAVDIPFSSSNKVTWTYDAASNSYLRSSGGSAFIDAESGKQISARNVVVLWAQYSAASRDVVGSTTYDIALVGSGRATVFRDGQVFNGTWEASADAPPSFVAEDGSPVKLGPGNTWIQVVNTSVDITMR